MRHDHQLTTDTALGACLLGLDLLDQRLFDTEQPNPYPLTLHAVSRFIRFVPSAVETYPGYGVFCVSALVNDPRKRQESHKWLTDAQESPLPTTPHVDLAKLRLLEVTVIHSARRLDLADLPS
ncbi:hypothetical protein [Streptomyces atratus]|uniref:hypothetical protein n=1 Tax=Streptomyces atratus TaxID=1893 RepID=UPI0033DE0AD0